MLTRKGLTVIGSNRSLRDPQTDEGPRERPLETDPSLGYTRVGTATAPIC